MDACNGAGNFASVFYTRWLDCDHLVQEDRNDAQFCQDETCKLDQLTLRPLRQSGREVYMLCQVNVSKDLSWMLGTSIIVI